MPRAAWKRTSRRQRPTTSPGAPGRLVWLERSWAKDEVVPASADAAALVLEREQTLDLLGRDAPQRSREAGPRRGAGRNRSIGEWLQDLGLLRGR